MPPVGLKRTKRNNMEVTVTTKFNVGDTVYGYYHHGLIKFRIDRIKVEYDSRWRSSLVRYECTAIVPKDCEVTFTETFEESCLVTKSELIEVMRNLIEDEN